MYSLDTTVLNFFDEFEIFISRFDITHLDNVKPDYILHKIIDMIGNPKNYGPTAEELFLISQEEDENRSLLNTKLLTRKFNWEMEEASRKCTNEAIWTAQTNAIQLQKFDYLECQAMPLRNYLMSFVMPTLTRGLVNISKSNPDDPIDYLAEFLFKNNPCID
ncbi:Adenylate kinase 7-like [Oopsacas minuta]|uniref:Adenylate kinase 7-like n=1 Tax=Oopsacas minuta TaxID=111878 RepID=A0AAV7JJW8_9METZ|nr:Adenylate kinase 7-like [Oopsacas minuta]